ARESARLMDRDKTHLLKSSGPVGTADRVLAVARETLAELGKGMLNVSIVSNPEFLRAGSAVYGCIRPDRIVAGRPDEATTQCIANLSAPFNPHPDPTLLTDHRTAAPVKYAANAMLATRISFMNEIALLADRLGVDVNAVRKGLGSDSRIGYHFLYPGCGFGGSCFPKDLKALIRTAEEQDVPPLLLRAVSEVNN